MNYEHKSPPGDGNPKGRYANYFKVGYNAFEFVLDLSQFYPRNGGPQRHTRIITTPAYAKALLETLQESIERYEQTYGIIHKEDEEDSHA